MKPREINLKKVLDRNASSTLNELRSLNSMWKAKTKRSLLHLLVVERRATTKEGLCPVCCISVFLLSFWEDKQTWLLLLVLRHFFTSLFAPLNTSRRCLYPINPREPAKMAGIMNKVYSIFVSFRALHQEQISLWKPRVSCKSKNGNRAKAGLAIFQEEKSRLELSKAWLSLYSISLT